MDEGDINTPLCIHLRKAPCRFHFNAVLQVVFIVTFCHKNRLTTTLAALSILVGQCGPLPMPHTHRLD